MSAPRPQGRAPLITFEGGEGGGKSTQAKMLGRRIRAMGLKVLLTREPGGTSLGLQLRDLVLGANQEAQDGPLDAPTELLLFLADRSRHVRSKIIPALERGEVVVCDRFVDSSEVYQGLARGLGHQRVRQLNQWICGDCWPDLTLLLDLDPAVGLARVASRQAGQGQGLNAMELEAMTFHQKLRQGFLAQAAAEPGRIRLIDAAGPPEDVAEAVWAVAEPVLLQWKNCLV